MNREKFKDYKIFIIPERIYVIFSLNIERSVQKYNYIVSYNNMKNSFSVETIKLFINRWVITLGHLN